jgi:hypothetical protein
LKDRVHEFGAGDGGQAKDWRCLSEPRQEILSHRIHGGDGRLDQFPEQLTFRGEFHAATAPPEQVYTQLALQRPDLLANRRARQAQQRGGRCVRAMHGNRAEGAEVLVADLLVIAARQGHGLLPSKRSDNPTMLSESWIYATLFFLVQMKCEMPACDGIQP